MVAGHAEQRLGADVDRNSLRGLEWCTGLDVREHLGREVASDGASLLLAFVALGRWDDAASEPGRFGHRETLAGRRTELPSRKMPIDEAKIRELMTRTEGETLDFKEMHHAKPADLAKDLMALANMLPAHAPPSYLLVGVAEVRPYNTGRIANTDPAHLDEANYRSKVEPLILPVPDFSFDVVPVRDEHGVRRIGVFEVRPGRRPIFAIADATDGEGLVRNAAYKRAGKRNVIATPLEIIEWARQDDLLRSEAALVNMRWMQSQLAVVPRIARIGTTRGAGPTQVDFVIRNDGRTRFVVEAARFTFRFHPHVHAAVEAVGYPDTDAARAVAKEYVAEMQGDRSITEGQDTVIALTAGAPEEDYAAVARLMSVGDGARWEGVSPAKRLFYRGVFRAVCTDRSTGASETLTHEYDF